MPRKNKTKREATPALRLEYRTASELTDNPRNWRTHPQPQLAALRDVIDECGWAGVVLFNERTGRLIDGHARKNVARPDEQIPVLVGSWDEATEAKLLITIDPLSAMATADTAALDALMRDVQTSSENVAAMLKELAEKNWVIPALPEAGQGGDEFDTTPDQGPTRSKLGDVWLIGGKHRVMCGDSTKADDVAKLMDGEKAGLCFTSPPYAQQRDYGKKIDDWDGLMQGVFANLPMTDDGQVLVNLGLCYHDGNWFDYWTPWTKWMEEKGWRRFGWYIWDKISAPPGDWCGRFGPAHEWIFHFNRKSREVNHIIPKKAESIKLKTGSSLRYADGSLHTANYSPESGLNTHKIPDSVWRFHVARTGGKVEVAHPAVYPVDLPGFAAEAFTQSGEAIFDPFGGSGTTLIAAHRLDRKAYLMELEPRYVDVILKRATAEGLTVELSE